MDIAIQGSSLLADTYHSAVSPDDMCGLYMRVFSVCITFIAPDIISYTHPWILSFFSCMARLIKGYS
jgi:hypothetical protein